MDSDKFTDPRTRSSKRGRGRGRGRGTRGTHGRGKGGTATHGRGGRAAGAGKKTPTGTDAAKKRAERERERLGSNAFRFDEYDERRLQSRRAGVSTDDFEYYDDDAAAGGRAGCNSDEDDADADLDNTGHKPVDNLGADAPDAHFLHGRGEEEEEEEEEEGQEEGEREGKHLLQQTLRADFSGLADVLDSVPLWARLGTEARFGLQADACVLDDLVESYEDDDEVDVDDSNACLEAVCKTEDDVLDMMRDVDAMGLGNEELTVIDEPAGAQATARDAAGAVDTGHVDDDDFDRWLDQV